MGDTPRLSRCVFHDQTVAVAVEAQRVIRRYCEGSEGARTSREARRADPVCHIGTGAGGGFWGDGRRGGVESSRDSRRERGGHAVAHTCILDVPTMHNSTTAKAHAPKVPCLRDTILTPVLEALRFPRGTAGGRAAENLWSSSVFSYACSRFALTEPNREKQGGRVSIERWVRGVW